MNEDLTLEQRVERLEKLVSDTYAWANSKLDKLEKHPLFGSIIRMIKE